MSKAYEKIAAGLTEAIAYADGTMKGGKAHVPASVDVKSIRAKTGLTQERFAGRFGFTTTQVRDWEQRRRNPDAAARVLLLVIDREPQAVDRALHPKSPLELA